MEKNSSNACEGGNKERRKSPLWIKIGIVIFALVFVVAGFITGRKLLLNSQGEKAYDELRLQVSQTNYENSMAEAESHKTDSDKEQKKENTQQKQMDFTLLKAVNDDIVAWIKLEGSVIDYPVMHGADNEYYLHHIYTGEANGYGALFADYRNTGLFTDRNTVIYGHHMNDGSMFCSLASYKTQDYYEQFPEMLLYTPDGDYKIELFCGTVESGDSQFVRFDFDSDEDFLNYVNSFKERSTFKSGVTVEAGDRLVSLCTCSYEINNARFMVIGKLTPLYEESASAISAK